MQTIRQDIHVTFRYDVHFVTDAFNPENDLLGRIVETEEDLASRKILTVIDEGLLPHYPDLPERVGRLLFAPGRCVEPAPHRICACGRSGQK